MEHPARVSIITLIAAAIVWAAPGLAQVAIPTVHGLASAASTGAVDKFTKLAINGNGTTNYASANCATHNLVCPSGHLCQCFETTGTYKGNVVGSGTFDFLVADDVTTALDQGSGLGSFGASGFLTLTSGTSTLVIETNGLLANPPLEDAIEYGGSCAMSSGTGKFATTIGTGQLSWNAGSNDTQISMAGNIDLKP